MVTSEFKNIIQERIRIGKISQDEDSVGIEKCWNALIVHVTQNLPEMIAYIRDGCTEEEFSYLSEVFEEIADQTQSRDFIRALYETAAKYPEESEKYNVITFIKDAEALISR